MRKALAALTAIVVMTGVGGVAPITTDDYPGWFCRLIPLFCPK